MILYRKRKEFCRPVSTGASERMVPWVSPKMLKSSVLLLLCCLAVGTNAVPIPSSRSVERRSSSLSNKDHCQHHFTTLSTSCSFHDTCIESTFQCGTLGLALGYAQPRCEKLRLLRHSDSSCPECIQTQAILEWVLLSESCFQSGLLSLAKNQTSKLFPDPPDCLNFETDALDILEQCYSEGDSFCQLMDSVGLDVLESDLKVVLNAVMINSYYKSIVMKQLRNRISSCSHLQAQSLATKVAPETESMLLCVSFTIQNELIDDGLAEVLAEKLKQSPTDFNIAEYDPDLSSSCKEESDPDWSVSSAEYYLVHWTVSTGADKTALTHCQSAGDCTIDNRSPLIYFKYSDPTTSSCGNGLREAGELCDSFVYIGKKKYGCSKQCLTIPGHECTTHHLQQSFCSKVECGDGRRTSKEECDGGPGSSMGCDPVSCTVQEGYECESPYNITSHCTESASPSPSQIIPTSSTQLATNPSTSSPISRPQSPSEVQALEVEPTNGGLASSAQSIQRTLHLWCVVLTQLIALLLFHLVWR